MKRFCINPMCGWVGEEEETLSFHLTREWNGICPECYGLTQETRPTILEAVDTASSVKTADLATDNETFSNAETADPRVVDYEDIMLTSKLSFYRERLFMQNIPAAVEPMELFVEYESLRSWWHEVLRLYDRYPCYAFFLALPSNQMAIEYIDKFRYELSIVSHVNCLIIALGKRFVMRSVRGLDEYNAKIIQYKGVSIKEQIEMGYSVIIAEHLGIGLDRMPCLIIFDDIRSPHFVIVDLRDLDAIEIAKKIAATYSLIEKIVSAGKKVLPELQKNQIHSNMIKMGRSVVDKAGKYIEKSFETAVEVWLKSIAK